MRLTCPNCGAQYEVPPEAIPPGGRDVQCSACGRTWFERSSAEAPEPWDLVRRVTDDEEEADDLAEAQAAPPPVPRSTVTPEVAGILKAEAEREAQARAEEAAKRAVPVTDRVTDRQTPPATDPATLAVIDRPAPARPSEPPIPEPAPPAPRPQPARPARAPERPLDIEQINSSLRTANDRIGGRVPQVGPPRRRGGFASGFWGALLVLALLAGLYVVTPNITAAWPEAAIVLDPYVSAVNQARDWLDQQVGAFLGAEPPAG